MSMTVKTVGVLALGASLALPAAAGKGQTYGKGVGAAEVVQVSALLAHPEDYVGKRVRIRGLVTDVCPKRGCWLKIAGDKEFQSMRVKVDDGVIVFPVEVRGKRVDVEGVFTKHVLTREQAQARAKHHAEETGQAFDPTAVKDGEVFYQIKGDGAVVAP